MNKATLISKLEFIKSNQPGLEMYFLCRKDDLPIEIKRANLEGTDTKSRLEKVFVDKIKYQLLNQISDDTSLPKEENWHLKHIKDVDELMNTYYYFPNEAIANVEDNPAEYHIPEEFMEMVKLWDLQYENVNLFEHNSDSLDDVFAYLIRLQIDDKQVILFKHKYPIDVLSRSTVLKMVGHTSKFSLEKEPLLKVSDKIDFLFIDNTFIVLNLKLLESKYGFNERYLKIGSAALDFIRSRNIIIDTKVLEELSKTVSFSKKLMKIKKENEVLKTSISDMKTFLEEYKTKDGKISLAKRIKYYPTKNKFEIKTKVAAEDFLRLLNDQFLISLLTKKPYIADVQTEFKADEELKSKETKKRNNAKSSAPTQAA